MTHDPIRMPGGLISGAIPWKTSTRTLAVSTQDHKKGRRHVLTCRSSANIELYDAEQPNHSHGPSASFLLHIWRGPPSICITHGNGQFELRQIRGPPTKRNGTFTRMLQDS